MTRRNEATDITGMPQSGEIKALGYIDPSNDQGDLRQVKIWNYVLTLLKIGFELKIIKKYNFKDFAPRTHAAYKFFQTRSDGEGDQSGIEDYFNQFYVGKEHLERIPFCIKHDELVFALSGNKRMQAHKMGVDARYESRCDIALLIPPSNLELCEIYDVGNTVAKYSNLRSNTTRDTHGTDHAGMCQSKFEIIKMREPEVYGQFTEEQKVEWAKEYLVEHIDSAYGYDTKGKKAALTRVANEAFSSAIAPPLAMPKGDNLSDIFNSFWPNSIWDPNGEKVICLFNPDGIWVNLEQKLTSRWLNRSEFTSVRKPLYLVTKVGKRNMTSLASVKSEREKMLKKLKEWNTNPNVVQGGACLVRKTLFTAQLSHEEDGATAYEWNEQTEMFDAVKQK